MSPLSTEQVAAEVKIGRVTLERWLASGRLKSPKTIMVGKLTVRHWTPKDVERVRKYREENYAKGRGRKKAKKKV